MPTPRSWPDKPKWDLGLDSTVPLSGSDLVSIDDLSEEDVASILRLARRFDTGTDPADRRLLEDRVVATAFFEPSTRTRLSFEAASHRLGARVIGFTGAEGTSTKKGETLEDTARMLAAYTDLIVIRHSEKGSARRVQKVTDVPVVNAGDGAGEHPTQALLDLYTIEKERGRTGDHQVTLVGDLKNGRTVHSLAVLLARLGNKITFVAPPALQIPEAVAAACEAHGAPTKKIDALEKAAKESDVIYMTRLQKERFQDPQEAARHAGSYTLTPEILKTTREDLTILHPLPRQEELPPGTDAHPGAAYFRQAKNGVPVRMSILTHLLSESIP